MKLLGLKSLIRVKNISHIKENRENCTKHIRKKISKQPHQIKNGQTDITEFNVSGINYI
jgi:predicted nuclease with TOPRIM domain